MFRSEPVVEGIGVGSILGLEELEEERRNERFGGLVLGRGHVLSS
jgi:hypothetical protein